MRKFPGLCAVMAAATLLSAPAHAQKNASTGAEAVTGAPAKSGRSDAADDKDAAALAKMAELFAVQPLTAEQTARLPQAELLVASIMPPGTLDEMMTGMFDGVLGPLMKLGATPGSSAVAELLGMDESAIEMSDEDAAEAVAILDPAWTQRQEATLAATRTIMPRIMQAMEPGMRKGMAEAFAVHFTTTELTDIQGFFATPSGASYARKSYKLSSDPRIMSAAMGALPELMGQFASMEADISKATAGLPAARTHGTLSAAERARLAELTGLTPAEIKAGMSAAASAAALKDGND